MAQDALRIEWQSAFDTQHEEIDLQHRQLIDLINRLGRHAADNRASAELSATFEGLAAYIGEHFRMEEDLMALHPVLAAHAPGHIAAHQGFIATVDRARPLVHSHPADVITHLTAFLVKWLLFHINGQDRVMVALMQGLPTPVDEPTTVRSEAAPLMDMVSRLYDSLSDRTIELLAINTRLEREIDERRRLEAELRTSEERWKLALEAASEGVWDWSLDDRRITYSPTWKRMLGFRDDAIGNGEHEWLQRIHVDDRERFDAALALHVAGEREHLDCEVRVLHADGQYRWILTRGMIFTRAGDGRPLRMVGTHTDITERKEREMRTAFEAMHDQLTGLPNRSLFQDRVRHAQARLARSQTGFAIAFLDLDRFKPINDTLGHHAGDLVLVEVARRLVSHSREIDTVCRLGGDEFLVLLADVDDRRLALDLLARIAAAIGEPILVADTRLQVGCSIGVSLAPRHGTTFETLLQHADTEMYRVKRSGRGRVAVRGD